MIHSGKYDPGKVSHIPPPFSKVGDYVSAQLVLGKFLEKTELVALKPHIITKSKGLMKC